MKDYEIKECKSCSKEFKPKRSNQVNCTAECPKNKRIMQGKGITKKKKYSYS